MAVARSQLTEILTQTRRPRVLVVGDVMLDRYVWGDVDRISPEAPIPVLKVHQREERLGGAGSVVAMLAALDADVVLATVVAADADGQTVRELLGRHGAIQSCTFVSADRSTTVKERLLGRTHSRNPQQMIRVDHENSSPIGDDLVEELLAAIRRHLDVIDLVLVSDYDKGICGDQFITELVALARDAQIPVVADPAGGVNYRRYAGCTCITPNRSEAGLALGQTIDSIAAGLKAARDLLGLEVDSAVVTLDRDGIAWADNRGRNEMFPVQPRQVYDITGAGDMVLSALGYSLAMGADWPAAIELANLAGGLEVQRLGVEPVTRRELLAELSSLGFSANHKVVTVDQLLERLRRRRSRGQRVVMTNGCFDMLHPGHVASLHFARSQGDCLVVGLNSDQSVVALKGPDRPIMDQEGRAEILATMECVDFVVIFDDVSVTGLVRRVRPDILVKAAQYAPEEVVGHEVVTSYGGKVVLAPMHGAYSTSDLIAKIRSLVTSQ